TLSVCEGVGRISSQSLRTLPSADRRRGDFPEKPVPGGAGWLYDASYSTLVSVEDVDRRGCLRVDDHALAPAGGGGTIFLAVHVARVAYVGAAGDFRRRLAHPLECPPNCRGFPRVRLFDPGRCSIARTRRKPGAPAGARGPVSHDVVVDCDSWPGTLARP